MNKVNLSIVIPCYNSEDTIGKTLDCFVREFSTISFNYEIIVLDDGSTDGSVSEIKRFANANKNITLIQKENSGVSDTRNFGLGHAKGEYVWFFDSDDLLFNNVGQKISEWLMLVPPADIIRFGSVTVDSKTKRNIESFNNIGQCKIVYKGKYRDYLYKNKTGFSCWGLIVRRELLIKHGIKFNPTLSIGEDVLWNVSIAKECGDADLLVSNLSVVKYVVNSNSIVNTVNPKSNYRYYNNSLQLHQYLLSIHPVEDYLSPTLQHFKETSLNQIITKFLSCKFPLKQVKEETNKVNDLIYNEKVNNRYSKVFGMLSKNVIVTYLSQALYRNIFLRYVKPFLGRN